MTEPLYDLSFKGDLIDGFFQDFVKADLQTLVKADEKYINLLFSGSEQSIKRGVDKATAIKFQQAFKKAGAKLVVRPHKSGASTEKVVQSAQPTSNSAAEPIKTAPAPKQEEVQPSTAEQWSTTLDSVPGESRPELSEHHQPDIKAPEAIPDWSVSEPGAQLGDTAPEQAVEFDFSDLSVAEAGEDLILEKPIEPAPPALNLDSLSLAEAGATLETLQDDKEPVQVDISHLSTE
ncbi:hypothetical protein QWZ13_17455 [Reinekea marina]|uniref:Uncharacterized protein n=1 Tax=Reinekea marina TaxID=1310421 RepID=A0ABV7WL90_9GAMM|nr:hypothetical protein [Reinekea marina]MDN3650696.1 hypothetical protein [Reinekea marina]